MAKQTEVETTAGVNIEDLGSAIARGIIDANNQTGPIKQVPLPRYRGASNKNAAGLPEYLRPKMARDYSQNGNQISRWMVSDADVALLNQLKAGRYVNRKVEVVVFPAEGGGIAQVDIRYSNASLDQRLELKNDFRTFTELLQRIVEEQTPAA